MARTGIQTEAVELLQFLDALQAVRIERALPLESVQNYALLGTMLLMYHNTARDRGERLFQQLIAAAKQPLPLVTAQPRHRQRGIWRCAFDDLSNRFKREARMVGALNHPNILAVYDVGAQDETHYIVTELLQGATLREKLRDGPLPAKGATG